MGLVADLVDNLALIVLGLFIIVQVSVVIIWVFVGRNEDRFKGVRGFIRHYIWILKEIYQGAKESNKD